MHVDKKGHKDDDNKNEENNNSGNTAKKGAERGVGQITVVKKATKDEGGNGGKEN